jgi:uncharacterized protein YjbI with pentapeptide repeats
MSNYIYIFELSYFAACNSFSSAQLSSAQLSSAQLISVQFSSVQFSSAQLSSVQLSSAQLNDSLIKKIPVLYACSIPSPWVPGIF